MKPPGPRNDNQNSQAIGASATTEISTRPGKARLASAKAFGALLGLELRRIECMPVGAGNVAGVAGVRCDGHDCPSPVTMLLSLGDKASRTRWPGADGAIALIDGCRIAISWLDPNVMYSSELSPW